MSDYLISEQDTSVLQNLTKMGEKLKELKQKMLDTEAAAKEAKKEYDYYASSVLPMEMLNVGIDELKLSSGGRLKIERKFYCQPNKNDADRLVIAQWLQSQGGKNLIKESANVDKAFLQKLKDNEIPFKELKDINTNSLKAFIKDKLGIDGGTQQIQMEDIPECIHFQEVSYVEVEL